MTRRTFGPQLHCINTLDFVPSAGEMLRERDTEPARPSGLAPAKKFFPEIPNPLNQAISLAEVVKRGAGE